MLSYLIYIIDQRAADTVESSDEEETTTPSTETNVPTCQQVFDFLNGTRRFLEHQDDGSELYLYVNLLERYVNKKHLSGVNARQQDITSFIKK